MRPITGTLFGAALSLLLLGCGAGVQEPADEVESATPQFAAGFASLFEPYEKIRVALAEDGSTNVAATALELAAAARVLVAEFSAARAGVESADSDDVLELLGELSVRADRLAAAEDLEELRAGFGALSDMMLDYRDRLTGPAPLVAYCPMLDKSWLQASDEIGNPYYGSMMLSCGEISDR